MMRNISFSCLEAYAISTKGSRLRIKQKLWKNKYLLTQELLSSFHPFGVHFILLVLICVNAL